MQNEKRYNELVLLNQLFRPLNDRLKRGEFIQDKSGVKLVELIAPRLELDPMQPILNFGAKRTNERYAGAELAWYKSMSLSVESIGHFANLWNMVASSKQEVNSNYGWCAYSDENYNQFQSAVKQLRADSTTRRACMIYNRPSMQDDWCRDGMNDFICTFAT